MNRCVSQLPSWNLTGKRVVLRADLNVPLENNSITSDFRLKALLPTLALLRAKNARITLITHLGRPDKPTPELSTQLLLDWFEQHGYPFFHAATIEQAQTASGTHPFILLENIRFFKEEQEPNNQFALKLAQLGDYYVNDAFGTLHRTDTSVTLLAEQFAPDHRSIGLLIEQELNHLSLLLDNPPRPFCIILGGGKGETKLPLVINLLKNIDTLLLAPAISFIFLKAEGKQIGSSYCQDDLLPLARNIIRQAHERGIKILYPTDYQVAHGSINGPLRIIESDEFTEHDFGMSIGPRTIEQFEHAIQNSSTIFLNGSIGLPYRQETMTGMKSIIEAMAQSQATTLVAGGDSVAAAQQAGFADHITHLSSGGGATLAYLSGQELPALKILCGD